MIDGCKHVPAWRNNVHAIARQQCDAEAHKIIEALVHDDASLNSLAIRAKKYLAVRKRYVR